MLKFKSHLPKLILKANGVKYSKGLTMIGWPVIARLNDATINLGENVHINSSLFSNLLGLYQRTIIVARGNGKISIGDNVGMSGVTIYSRGEITIEDNVTIGANTKIFDNDFHPLDADARRENDLDKLEIRPVYIGEDVFIGCNCIITKGSTIGKNSVVGAGSVVHGNIPENVVVAGNPAKVIKSID